MGVGMGRKRKPLDPGKTETYSIGIPPDGYAALRALADEDRRSLSQEAAVLILAEAARRAEAAAALKEVSRGS